METSGRIWPNFELIQALVYVIITCKYEKDPTKNSRELEFMFMKHYAPNRCEPCIGTLNFRGGGGGIRADVNGEVKFLRKLKKYIYIFLFIFFWMGGGGGGRVGGSAGGVMVDVNREVKFQ